MAVVDSLRRRNQEFEMDVVFANRASRKRFTGKQRHLMAEAMLGVENSVYAGVWYGFAGPKIR